MMRNKLIVIGLCSLTLMGCSSKVNMDLLNSMQEKMQHAERTAKIDPLPQFDKYVPTVYKASSMRSPFALPNGVVEKRVAGKKAKKPDLKRTKQTLEQFNITELAMVGSIEVDNTMWALILDRDTGVHRVKEGRYIGKNLGKVVEVFQHRVDLIEVIMDGQGGWIQRPRQLHMRTSNE